MYIILYLSANKSYETEITKYLGLHLPMRESILEYYKKVPVILFVG